MYMCIYMYRYVYIYMYIHMLINQKYQNHHKYFFKHNNQIAYTYIDIF